MDSLSQAEALAGAGLFVPGDSPLPDQAGRPASFELVGCAVWTKRQEKIGTVKDVWPIGESILLVVEGSHDAKEILIPFNQVICPDVDVLQKRIVIDPPDGLLDLNEI